MSEVEALNQDLARLPADQREALAAQFRYELKEQDGRDWWNRLPESEKAEIKAAIDRSRASGDAGPLDMEEILNELHAEEVVAPDRR